VFPGRQDASIAAGARAWSGDAKMPDVSENEPGTDDASRRTYLIVLGVVTLVLLVLES
jgi:hypothetical protein